MIDRFRLWAKAGDGGNGCSSFRRSRHDRHGRPDGEFLSLSLSLSLSPFVIYVHIYTFFSIQLTFSLVSKRLDILSNNRYDNEAPYITQRTHKNMAGQSKCD